uniref:Uncharacterized protein n=1 Tax=Glossina pallidipes TaxID=7398 RepID=A0A1B0A8I1_GLOPL
MYIRRIQPGRRANEQASPVSQPFNTIALHCSALQQLRNTVRIADMARKSSHMSSARVRKARNLHDTENNISGFYQSFFPAQHHSATFRDISNICGYCGCFVCTINFYAYRSHPDDV